MGFCHDIGKTATALESLPSHHGHEHVGERLAHELGNRLRLPRRFIRAGAAAARWHMIAGRYHELRAGTRVDLLIQLDGLKLVPEMMALVAADKPGLEVARMAADLKTILAVRLPPQEMGQGARSGDRLRQRRCQALGQRSASHRI
jgi:tRNA nucleotidyltransferase (CCA-adding enzyme)